MLKMTGQDKWCYEEMKKSYVPELKNIKVM
jgi:hypothetical protein